MLSAAKHPNIIKIRDDSCFQVAAQTAVAPALEDSKATQHLFIDVHQLEPGKVKFEDVQAAHVKDLQVQGKRIVETHKEAHGLVPEKVLQVKQGE